MARQETQREDLIRDAIALVDRIEFVSDSQPSIVVGFRRDGSVSFYFGEEPVYQFNTARELRRAHLDGILKAEGGSLVRLHRRRGDREVQLVRETLDVAVQQEFVNSARTRLVALSNQIENGQLRAGRQVSADNRDVLARVRDWLARLPTDLTVADAV